MAAARLPLLAGLLLLAGLGASAAQQQQLARPRPEGDCLAPAVESVRYDFFPASYQLQRIGEPVVRASSNLETTVETADDFTVTYRGTYKVMTNERAGETYVLYQCGTPNPVALGNTEVSLPAGTKAFEVPLHSVSLTDSNAAAFVAALGLTDRVAFASEYSVDECLQAIHGCTGPPASAAAPANYGASEEAFAATLAAWNASAAAQHPGVDAILTNEATPNPKSIAVTAFADPGVLNRAEWVKFVAVFFNKEVEANRLFADISSDYQALNASGRAAPAPRPRVAWLDKFGDAVSLNYATFKTQYMQDAGGVLAAPADAEAAGGRRVEGPSGALKFTFNASVPAEVEGLAALLQDVDIIFDDSFQPGSVNFMTLGELAEAYGPELAAVPAIAAGSVYTFNGRLNAAPDNAGSDWFESSVARPDLVLRDFVAVISPSALPAAANGGAAPQLRWLRRLPVGAANAAEPLRLAPADCASVTGNASASGGCSRQEPARICPNAYRDCSTGELKTVTDPSQRCDARTVCPDVGRERAPAAAGGSSSGGGAARASALLAAFAGLVAAAAAL